MLVAFLVFGEKEPEVVTEVVKIRVPSEPERVTEVVEIPVPSKPRTITKTIVKEVPVELRCEEPKSVSFPVARSVELKTTETIGIKPSLDACSAHYGLNIDFTPSMYIKELCATDLEACGKAISQEVRANLGEM